MGRRMKAYLPRWMLRLVIPMLVLVWLVISYVTFATPEGREDPGVVVWSVITLVLALVGVMVWLMGTGKLPAYEIEIEDTDEPRER